MNSIEIDWKILVGQIINFAILFFILKSFLYKPFLTLLEKRRQKIEEGISKSLEAEEKLSGLKDLKLKMEKENDEEKKIILLKAQEEAKKRSEEIDKKSEEDKALILLKAKKEAEEIKLKEREATERKTIENAFSLAENLLKENIDEKKGKEITEDFLNKLKI
jgi:F-type H+-transporting ATPase subunit b